MIPGSHYGLLHHRIPPEKHRTISSITATCNCNHNVCITNCLLIIIIIIISVNRHLYCTSNNTCKDRWHITSNCDDSNDDNDNDKNTDEVTVIIVV